MIMIESPTGLGIRNDRRGSGYYGVSRGNRKHLGVDFQCVPGQEVKSPIDGTVLREARPYADDPAYSGVVIEGARITVKMFYCIPRAAFIGMVVRRGTPIATAQDISKKYGEEMTPHIHLQIESVDPTILMEKQGG